MNTSSEHKPQPIGIFDSGVGGLTVARQIIKLLPEESIVYFGDTARVPYGTKSDRIVREFTWEDCLFLLWHGVKLIVAACNTASAIALDELDRYLQIPVVGVIKPGARAAAESTQRGIVGVIGTQATVDSKSYQKEIHRIDPDIQVHVTSCPLFVPLAEEGWTEGEIPKLIAEKYLQPLLLENIDTLILGCTHYPLLKPLLQDILGDEVTMVDSALETAKDVAALMTAQDMLSSDPDPQRNFYVSDLPRRFEDLGQRFLGEQIGTVSIAEPWKGSPPSQFDETK
ncbi:glutamate racemase [candidate division LCP-89 bacterium B3_LCP]|uniref:Glutamate racemase n=1 Tax=candidate division LCP-89 bacterium B3_LCP TaxID=2012998 RepID=A0A532UYE1_UNCL8|nr:MAG: glutamate racemase [candidate division LCP-89 bacterium B3_LCP]